MSRPSTRRPPLGEATRRVNNTLNTKSPLKTSHMPHHESLGPNGLLQGSCHDADHVERRHDIYDHHESPQNRRVAAIAKAEVGSNRDSIMSTTSTNSDSSRKLKSHIGPWTLGKTLGKGSTARVRLARHKVTGQKAAIKIVQKRNAQMSQAGSLADLEKAEYLEESEDELRRMPVGIEREVAIMKLIQHPNIMKLYDIWENRTEIYLVLEYVDKGELFSHIAVKGRLREEEAMKYFRQMLSAVGYCHSFKICHRDLKPENILLNNAGDIKVADFGMAALQQSPDHRLNTSCGSPHYAAPELIKGSLYQGSKVDIWSLGVILFASLAGRLPFDIDGSEQWIGPLLMKIRRGHYEMEPWFSDEAKSLIKKMLEIKPDKRITMPQIWKHALLRKYDYLDELSGGSYPLSPKAKDVGRPVLRRSDVSKDLLRHLRTMWHKLSEQELMDALLSEQSNDQKLFYSLLVKYRDAQLENYTPDLDYSTSDYHHVKPLAMTKTYSTCHFPRAGTKGHGRQTSKFTVVSNHAPTERSYDPFKASRPQHLNKIQDEPAKITIYRSRNKDDASYNQLRQTSRASSGASKQNPGRLAPPKTYASRSSMASSTRSRNSGVRATVGSRRGVSFNPLPRTSTNSLGKFSMDSSSIPVIRHSNHTEVTDDGGDVLRPVETPPSTAYIRSRKDQTVCGTRSTLPKASRNSQLWTEDVRQHSTTLAKDCDEAFNRSTVSVDQPSGESKSVTSSKRKSAPSETRRAKRTTLDTRPLPPPPSRTASVNAELLEARKQAELRKRYNEEDSPGYLERMVTHIDRLMQPLSPASTRRISSAPVETRNIPTARPLPSINEDATPRNTKYSSYTEHEHRRAESRGGRHASAPEPRERDRKNLEDRFGGSRNYDRKTIRVVSPSSSASPAKVPAPLTIRKKSSQTGSALKSPSLGPDDSVSMRAGRQYQPYRLDASPDLGRIEENRDDEEVFGNSSNVGTILRKKSSWFKRSSKGSEDDYRMSVIGTEILDPKNFNHADDRSIPDRPRNPTPHLASSVPEPPKKKRFGLGKFFKKSKPDMTVAIHDEMDDNASVQNSLYLNKHHSKSGEQPDDDEDAAGRKIAPRQNWMAKLFNMKPPARYICFAVSKRRGRREIAILLREWKKYGIRDLQIDKQRNIVFGKVGAANYLDMREVSFAAEVMTVIEHGKKSHLSIARFTQEAGAATSFQHLVETLETVLKIRTLLVNDERKKRMMVKTLNAA